MRSKIVILTGAGISAESGIATFRGPSGLWENHRVEDVATPEAFLRDPPLVQRFYNERRRGLFATSLKPNAAHAALAKLEREFEGDVVLVTQNIDDLHERAGNENVIHMHGKLLEVRCMRTGEIFEWKEDVTADSECSCCKNKKTLRPNIVWFGEIPFQMERIYRELETCTIFVAIGTSGNVYPAAGFVEHVRVTSNAKTVELNLEKSAVNQLFRERQYGPATEIVPSFVNDLLKTSNS